MAVADGSLTRRQRLVLLAAWLGWGFDVFDAVIFNHVAPHCIPVLLGLPLDSAAAHAATARWTGILTALLLVGWAAGGILFGHLADRIGRARTLTLTILVYALGTGACALATSLPFLIACRVVASLGIGGEFATGATLVAESVPPARRVVAGALLQTASPLFVYLAAAVTWLIAGVWLPEAPGESWRYVFACGLLPVAVVLGLRVAALEPPATAPTTLRLGAAFGRLFGPVLRPATLSALAMAVLGLFAWWCCNAFLPLIATGLGAREALRLGLSGTDAVRLAEDWKATASFWFNAGGLIGGLLTVPAAHRLGRRGLFALYYAAGAVALVVTFGPAWPAPLQLRLTFLVGLSLYGIFAAFTYYLPELFPAELRALGTGFSFNIGRLGAAAGPFLVGAYSARQADPTAGALAALTGVALLPLAAALLAPFIVETRAIAATARAP